MRRMHRTELQKQRNLQPRVSKQNQLGEPGTTGINKNTHCDPNETHVKELQSKNKELQRSERIFLKLLIRL